MACYINAPFFTGFSTSTTRNNSQTKAPSQPPVPPHCRGFLAQDTIICGPKVLTKPALAACGSGQLPRSSYTGNRALIVDDWALNNPLIIAYYSGLMSRGVAAWRGALRIPWKMFQVPKSPNTRERWYSNMLLGNCWKASNTFGVPNLARHIQYSNSQFHLDSMVTHLNKAIKLEVFSKHIWNKKIKESLVLLTTCLLCFQYQGSITVQYSVMAMSHPFKFKSAVSVSSL